MRRWSRLCYLPKMDTSKIAGIRWVDSSIVVITISSSELSIQGSNMYFFFCCRYLSAVSDDREPSTSYIAHRKKLRKRYGEKKANGLITIYLVFYFHIIIVAAKCVYSTQTKYKIQNKSHYIHKYSTRWTKLWNLRLRNASDSLWMVNSIYCKNTWIELYDKIWASISTKSTLYATRDVRTQNSILNEKRKKTKTAHSVQKRK